MYGWNSLFIIWFLEAHSRLDKLQIHSFIISYIAMTGSILLVAHIIQQLP